MTLFRNEQIDKFIYLSTCDSSNQYALNYLSKNNPSQNLAIYSFNQTKGRGQIGREWYTGSGHNLALSLIVIPSNMQAKDGHYINLWLANSVHKFISTILPDSAVKIKWPNDIYIGNRKIAGLLIQSNIQGSELKSCVMGIGLNVNEVEFPTEIPNPISLFQITKATLSLPVLSKKFFGFLSNELPSLNRMDKKEIKEYYTEHLYLKDINHEFADTKTGTKFFGKVIGINDDGTLRLIIENEFRNFSFRELAY